MNNQTQKTNLAEILNLENMSEDQRDETLARIGNIIIEASINSLLVTLNEEQVSKLEEYLKHMSDQDDVFAYLLRTYPDFQSIVEREVAALENMAKDVLA